MHFLLSHFRITKVLKFTFLLEELLFISFLIQRKKETQRVISRLLCLRTILDFKPIVI